MIEGLTHWQSERRADGVHILHIDVVGSSVNVLSAPVLDELDALLGELEADPPKALVIASAKPTGFIAGADIKEFTAFDTVEAAKAHIARGQGVMNRLANLHFPTLARIHGVALGGGLELVLACRYRVARDDARLGFPEVLLGIHPGFGGTARITRLIPAPAAMEMMLTGRPLDARTALSKGVVDAVAPERHLAAAVEGVLARGAKPKHRPFKLAFFNSAPVRPFLARTMRRVTRAKARPEHYPAPHALIDLWARKGGSAHGMLAGEVESFARLVVGDAARNMVRVFFLRERIKRLGRTDAPPIRHVHVVGAGVMGGDIAAWCALQGLDVTLQDREAKYIAPAIRRAAALFRRRLDPAKAQAALDRLTPDLKGGGVAQADVVIEAIIEDMEAKRALFREIEPRLKPGALLATNTSSIPLDDIAVALDDPSHLIGIHFFNPVAALPLIEIVEGENSGAEAIARGFALAGRIDRLPVPVKSAPGFLVNRVLFPYLLEAMLLLEEGTPAPAIDRAATDFGMPMGPIELADTVGLDICLHILEFLADVIGVKPPERLKRMVEDGKLGRKGGEGFYAWEGGRAVKPEAEAGAEPEFADRLILPILNTCAACLREGVVAETDFIDAAMIFGTGFAPFRGGPLGYAKSRGIDDVTTQLEALEARFGPRFHPDAGWALVARDGEEK
jgi:3-hydroxyacyl-CoA dehydrogenase/enoyl-CoA hydratase/3-hydroxybutyryl-CoA epimerase